MMGTVDMDDPFAERIAAIRQRFIAKLDGRIDIIASATRSLVVAMFGFDDDRLAAALRTIGQAARYVAAAGRPVWTSAPAVE